MIAAAQASSGSSDFITVAYSFDEKTIAVFSVQLATPALTLMTHQRLTYTLNKANCVALNTLTDGTAYVLVYIAGSSSVQLKLMHVDFDAITYKLKAGTEGSFSMTEIPTAKFLASSSAEFYMSGKFK